MVWVATRKLWSYKNFETSVMIWKTCFDFIDIDLYRLAVQIQISPLLQDGHPLQPNQCPLTSRLNSDIAT
jgi:hypothetical protein